MRLFDLLEALNTVTLYRGDASEIGQFEIDQTDPRALVGRGIYLTSSSRVAQDYTIKGDETVIYRSEHGLEGKELYLDAFWDLHGARLMAPMSGAGWTIQSMANKVSQSYDKDGGHSRTAQNAAFNEIIKLAQPVLLAWLRPQFLEAKNQFATQIASSNVVSTTTGETVITQGEQGTLKSFEFPKEYLDKTYRVDDPMDQDMIDFIIDFAATYSNFDLKTRTGLRYNDDDGSEQMASGGIDNWLELFKTKGARYAWTENNIGGDGKMPTLMQFVLGTHTGGSILNTSIDGKHDQFWEVLRGHLEPKGYIGFHYAGGTRTGTDTFAGGSPLLHDAYSLWDADMVNKSMVDSKAQTGTDANENMPKITFAVISRAVRKMLSTGSRKVTTDVDTKRVQSLSAEVFDPKMITDALDNAASE